MSDYLKRAFRSQLNSTIDSLLKTTLIEVTRIFEDSLHDHQVELAKKTEQISKLQMKLEWSENKLREKCSDNFGLAQASGDTQDLQTNVEIYPDINYGVPDWCVPLDCEVVDIQSPWAGGMDDQCPSVSLRPLSVSLLRIPVIKQEVEDDAYNSSLGTSPKKGGSPRRKLKHSDDDYDVHNVSLSPSAPKLQGVKIKKRLKHEKPEQADMIIRKSGRHNPGTNESRRIIRNSNKLTSYVYESEQREANKSNSRKAYRCKFCHMHFDTEFGRSVHIRSHKKCRLCHKVFPYPSFLRAHMKSCIKYKEEGTFKIAEVMHQAKPHESTKKTSPTTGPVPPQKTPSADDHNFASSLKIPPTEDDNTVSPQKATLAEDQSSSSAKHKRFTCSLCSRQFHMKMSLKSHILQFHKNKTLVNNGDLAWISSSEEVEENKGQLNLSSEEQTVTGEGKSDHRARHKRRKRNKIWWANMGEKAPNGFICSVCNKTLSNKHVLEAHFRIHTGEKPLVCELCGETFRCPQLKCMHKKKHHGTTNTRKKRRQKIYTEDLVL